jgi:hypothetical protein
MPKPMGHVSRERRRNAQPEEPSRQRRNRRWRAESSITIELA